MKIVTFDGGFHLDDPNIRWGDPSYLLEPGDPGYVPPISETNKPHKERKRMRRSPYYPVRMADQTNWLVNFYNKLPTYGTTVGLSAGDVTAAVADAQWLVYVLQSWLGAVRAWAQSCTDAVTEAQSGIGSNPMTLPVFTAPALPTGVVPVNPGALDRLFTLVQQIRDNPVCTDAIATDLGVIGSEKTPPDFTTLAPSFKVTRTAGGVNVGWGWGGNAAFLDMIELQVDRGDGQGWKLLAFDTTPGYLDTFAQPAMPAKWKYRGIYRVNDQQVGQWSSEISLNVGG